MLDYILGSSPVVSAVLLLLILASISSWAILIMKFRELRAAERDTEQFVEAYLESPVDTAYEVARRHGASPLATVFRSGYTELARLEKMQGAHGQLTRDQVELLGHDNIVRAGAPGFAELGIVPTAAEAILPTYLDRYRPGGRFAQTTRA